MVLQQFSAEGNLRRAASDLSWLWKNYTKFLLSFQLQPQNANWQKKMQEVSRTPVFVLFLQRIAQFFVLIFSTADSIALQLLSSQVFATTHLSMRIHRSTGCCSKNLLTGPPPFSSSDFNAGLLLYAVASLNPFHLVTTCRHLSLLSYSTHWVLILHVPTVASTWARRATDYTVMKMLFLSFDDLSAKF